LGKSADIARSTQRNIKSDPPTDSEIVFMIEMRRQGLSYGAVREKLFDRYGYAIDTGDIQRLVDSDTPGK